MHSAASDFQASVNASAKDVQDNIRSVETSLNASVAGETAPARERGAAPEPEPDPAPPSALALGTSEPPSEPSAGETPQQASLPGFERG